MQVSEISLGSWLTYGSHTDASSATACLKKAYECGINFFDTADVYGKGGAEAFLGETLGRFSRSSLVIGTKCFFPFSEDPNDRGLSRKHIFESVDRSLLRLKTDYVDLYQCHRYDEGTPLEETAAAMNDLIRMGKILYWGVSQWPAVRISEVVMMTESRGWHRPISNQPIYNIINRSLEVDTLQICVRNGIGNLVYSPLSQGVLTGKYRPGKLPEGSRAKDPRTSDFMKKRLNKDTLERVSRLQAVAASENLTLPQFALAWCLRKSSVSTTIIGASRPEQIEENILASGRTLSKESVAEVDRIMENRPVDQYTGNPI